MSVLDKWLSKYAHNGEVATFATTATNRNATHPFNGLVVANRRRQVATSPISPVLSPLCRQPMATESFRKTTFLRQMSPLSQMSPPLSSDHRRSSLPMRKVLRRSSASCAAATSQI
jgi:hypothetical protein